MQNFENNSWIILHQLGNIYEIYGYLTVSTTLLNLNHFWITQAELCLKGAFVKANFMLATIFLDIYQNPMRKTFIKPSCPKQTKIIEIWNKQWHKFLVSHSLLCLKKVLWQPENFIKPVCGTKKKCENKKTVSPSALIGIGTTRVKTVFIKLPTYAISISLPVELLYVTII